jgi:hypothetical protein
MLGPYYVTRRWPTWEASSGRPRVGGLLGSPVVRASNAGQSSCGWEVVFVGASTLSIQARGHDVNLPLLPITLPWMADFTFGAVALLLIYAIYKWGDLHWD